MPRYIPIAPEALVLLCADACAALPGRLVVGVVGAPVADPESLADRIAGSLRVRGRAAEVVRVVDYIRPASLRLEWGAHDAEAFATSWYDFPALRREVIDSLHADGSWLPRLWDGLSDRSFRDERQIAAGDQVIVIAGPMVLRADLRLDLGIALRMSRAALARRTPPDEQWTIDPLLDHERDAPLPDIEVRYDHPDRPAVSCRDRREPRH
ncbi:hypothetical protein ACLQ3C_19470 [Gordonia sp. DT30]|uniref:hypothetical protein n=1 Tax=unclassified Gordonia (in: high G+C Gram-positive bacteria) TaxID=2657482 RepID=UPI003CED27FF